MDLSKLPIFGMMQRRLDWLSQRQQVLALNIANADTPKYRPSDLKPLDFQKEIRKSAGLDLKVTVTSRNHITGAAAGSGPFRVEEQRRTFETAPDGNAVVLEEQMGKNNETAINHSLVTQLYSKHLQMLKLAVRSR